ncbi:MAG: hypothetical protein E7646_03565 [Ruminococcaceae bacterium]|nr:hypothetical protein [Oscillospiraceae bacterium]
MTNTIKEFNLAPKKLLIFIISLALIAVSAILTVAMGLNFNTEFGGGAAVSVSFKTEITDADVNKALDALKANCNAKIISVQKYSTDSVLIKTTAIEDTLKLDEALTAALGLKTEGVENNDRVNVANTQRYATKDAMISVASSFLVGAAVLLIYYIIRFGFVSTLASIFGLIVVTAVWLLPYVFGATFEYSAFAVLGVGVAAYAVETAVALKKKIKKASDLNVSSAILPVLAVTVVGILAALCIGIFSGAWSLAIALCFVFAGAAFASLFSTGSVILMIKK